LRTANARSAAASKAADRPVYLHLRGLAQLGRQQHKDTPAGSNAETTYTAQFTKTPRWYAVTFKNYDGAILREQLYIRTTKDTVTAAAPTGAKPDTAAYTFSFSGWSPSIADKVTGSATYTRQFTAANRTYSVTVNCKYADGTTAAPSPT
jgi:hypothetical protein